MENKSLITPGSAPEMSRTDDLPVGSFYKENGVRKLNLIVKNNINNVFAGIMDLQRFCKALDSGSNYVVLTGKPEQVGFTVQGDAMWLQGGGNNSVLQIPVKTVIELREVSAPNYVCLYGYREYDGRSLKSTTKFTLVDKGDGTTFIRASSEEENITYCGIAPWLYFCPCFLPFLPLCCLKYECRAMDFKSSLKKDLEQYLQAVKADSVSYAASRDIPAAAVAAQTDTAQQLSELKKLHDAGALSDEEFQNIIGTAQNLKI